MDTPLVIRGHFSHQAFVPDQPLPDIEGPAELIVYPPKATVATAQGTSVFDFFGKAPRFRSAEELDAQLREEREAWGDE